MSEKSESTIVEQPNKEVTANADEKELAFNGRIKALSYLQKERYNYLLSFYDREDALELLSKLDKTGINSWASVQLKLNNLKRSNFLQKEYEDSLYDAFELDESVTEEEVIQRVTTVRSDMSLDSYVDRIKVQSFNDFQNLFILEKVFANEKPETKRKKEIGYKPIFKLKS